MDLSKKMIIQNIDGEQFAWTLLQLEDGRMQATWREPITGAVGCTRPHWPSEFDDLDAFGQFAALRNQEQIRTINGNEYHLDGHDEFCIVSWLDDETGHTRRARIASKSRTVRLIPDADVLRAVNTPIQWVGASTLLWAD